MQLDMIESGSWVSEGHDVAVYDPSVLHSPELRGSTHPVQVVRLHRGRVERMMLKYGKGFDGTWGWWGMGDRAFMAVGDTLRSQLAEVVGALIRPEHAGKFEQVVLGLALEESPFGRDLARQIRGLLRSVEAAE